MQNNTEDNYTVTSTVETLKSDAILYAAETVGVMPNEAALIIALYRDYISNFHKLYNTDKKTLYERVLGILESNLIGKTHSERATSILNMFSHQHNQLLDDYFELLSVLDFYAREENHHGKARDFGLRARSSLQGIKSRNKYKAFKGYL